uniref:Ubiquitin-like domain-containing protein n=1 Tax=Globodera pallida TaxID=36090 RepID=A0A183C6N2_GLOPA
MMANNSNNSNVSAYDLSSHTISSTDNEEATTTVCPEGSVNEDDSVLYQMERKYFCCPYNDQKEKFEKLDDMPYIIDIFGSSPFQFGNSPLVAAHERVLELLVLDNLAIRRVGPFERFIGLAKNVTELLLSGNLLGWAEVSKLFRALPQLRVLNLSHNTALNTSSNDVEMAEAQKLDVLILNGLSLSFAVLRHVLPHAPALSELHLAKNNFVDISTSPPSPMPISLSLRELHLNDLFLAGNAIKTVDKICACGNETDRLCGELNALSLSNTMLSSWEAIENLESIRRLEELRVANIPLMDAYSEEERRNLVIGRLGALKLLNGSRIDERQREEAERFFIRYYTEVEKRPMVYERLVAEHGILEQLVKVDLTPKRYAKVLIRCDETEWVRTWVRLRLSGTVHALMQFAERLTNISIKMMRIFYMERSGFSPTELRVPSKQLRLLHIEDGDEFVVQSKMVLCAQPRQ